MQANYQQGWYFALLGGARPYPKAGVLRRALSRVGAQIIVSALVLFDIGSLGFALVAPIWLAPWVAVNLTALVLGTLSWSEETRIQRDSAAATRRQGEKVRAAEWRSREQLERKAQTRRQEAERRQHHQEEEREAQKRLQAALRQAQEELRGAEQRRYDEERARETYRQQCEQAERQRQAEQQRREQEQKRQQAEQEREAQRRRRRERKQAATSFQMDWWIVLGVTPSASKDEIVRKYRHKIKQCHPDRLVGLAPELLQLAEEQAKALNGAYANAMRVRRCARPTGAAI